MVLSKIRKPAVAGQFYSASASELKTQIESFVDKKTAKADCLACMLPHAGYIYSGIVAAQTLSCVKIPDRVIILGPNHTGYGCEYSIVTGGAWQTPLGSVEVDAELANLLIRNSGLLKEDELAHKTEHSIEVELPLMQYFNPHFKFVPIALMSDDFDSLVRLGKDIAQAIVSSSLKGSVLIVASSDMTHYEPEASAAKKDSLAIKAILDYIENYTGYQFITGPDLVAKFEEHMRNYNVELKDNEEAADIAKSGDTVTIKTDKAVYESKTAIIASGKRTRELGVPGEKEFKNKGLTYCATCDAPLFSGKDVAVVGGGNSALDATLQLMKIAKRVHLINIGSQLTGDPIMQEKVSQSDIVTVLNDTRITAIIGDKFVAGMKIKRDLKEEIVPVQGIFVEIGLIPNSKFAGGIDKNEYEEIKVDRHNQTNIPGIFAAGDVTDVPEKQIVIAAGEGSKAALGVFRYLSHRR